MNIILLYSKSILVSAGIFIFSIVIYNILLKKLWKNNLLKLLDRRIHIPFYLLILIISLKGFIAFSPHKSKEIYETYVNFFIYTGSIAFTVELLSFFIFEYIWIKRQAEVLPTIFRDIVKFIVYATLIIFVLNTFKLNITPFLTTAGIVTMVLGLALQDTLGNIFAGLAMQFSAPFMPGDIIEVEDMKGKVRKIDWRATHILTRSEENVIIPHSTMTKKDIKNYSRPTMICRKLLHIGLSYDTPPGKVKSVIMDVLKETEDICKKSEPKVIVNNFDEYSIIYEIEIPVIMTHVAQAEYVKGEVLKKLWYRLNRENIEIPYPKRTVLQYQLPLPQENTATLLIPILKKVDFLGEISEKKLEYLASHSKIEYYNEGETICRYGEKGESFYIIKNGSVDVYIPVEGKETKVKTLEENEFFGEMSLLTGEARSATVKVCRDAELIILTKKVFVELLREEPDVARTIGRIIAHRMEQTRDETSRLITEFQEEKEKINLETMSQQIFTRIKHFFSI